MFISDRKFNIIYGESASYNLKASNASCTMIWGLSMSRLHRTHQKPIDYEYVWPCEGYSIWEFEKWSLACWCAKNNWDAFIIVFKKNTFVTLSKNFVIAARKSPCRCAILTWCAWPSAPNIYVLSYEFKIHCSRNGPFAPNRSRVKSAFPADLSLKNDAE